MLAQNAIGAVLVMLLSAGALFVVVRTTLKPLGRLRDAMAGVAGGDLETAVPDLDRPDEIGHMAREVDGFRQGARAKATLEAEQQDEHAHKERRRVAMLGSIASFEGSVRGSLEALATAASEMRGTSRAMSETAEETRVEAGSVMTATRRAPVAPAPDGRAVFHSAPGARPLGVRGLHRPAR